MGDSDNIILEKQNKLSRDYDPELLTQLDKEWDELVDKLQFDTTSLTGLDERTNKLEKTKIDKRMNQKFELLQDIKVTRKFRKFKYKDMIFIRKEISNSDLSLHGACIQGNIREWLVIKDLTANEIFLIDIRNKKTSSVHFNKTGRLAGTNTWLRTHGDILKDSMYLFLTKKELNNKICIFIDFLESDSGFFTFIHNFYNFVNNYYI
ncbi:MAG: hypothetical protein ACFFCS_20335 [Candidatus Hodarchaeota archaeon]